MDYRDIKIEFTVLNSKEAYDKLFNDIYNISKDLPPEEIVSQIQQKITLALLWIRTMNRDALENFPLYRIRVQRVGEIINENKISEFYYPPNPAIGRANIAGQQVFYASADPHTPFHEKKDEIKVGKSVVYASYWGIRNCPEEVHMRSLFFGVPVNEKKDYASIMAEGLNEQAEKYFDQIPEEARDLFAYCQRLYTELFIIDSKDYYHLSSAIAHDTFVSALKQKADVPIITYPSVAKDKRAINFVIRKDFADKYLYLKHVDKMLVTDLGEETVKCTPITRGYVKNGEIEWRTIKVKVEKVHYEEAWICTEKLGRPLQPGECLTNCCIKHKVSLEEFMKKNNLTEDFLAKGITEIPEGLIDSVLSVSQKMDLMAELSGNVFAEKDIVDDKRIKYIRVPITYTIGYELN
jgi:hypothetical protein